MIFPGPLPWVCLASMLMGCREISVHEEASPVMACSFVDGRYNAYLKLYTYLCIILRELECLPLCTCEKAMAFM